MIYYRTVIQINRAQRTISIGGNMSSYGGWEPSRRWKSTSKRIIEHLVNDGADSFYQNVYEQIIAIFNHQLDSKFPKTNDDYRSDADFEWSAEMHDFLLDIQKFGEPKGILPSLDGFDPVHVRMAAQWYYNHLWPVDLQQLPPGVLMSAQ